MTLQNALLSTGNRHFNTGRGDKLMFHDDRYVYIKYYFQPRRNKEVQFYKS